MIKQILSSALFAGCAVGLLAALLHFSFVQKVLLLGEKYESGELVHFEAAPPESATAAHGHDDGHEHGHATDETAGNDAAGDDHHHGDAAEPGSFTRNGLTVLFTVLVYTSYAMILAAGFSVATTMGMTVGPQQGLLWGIAGFAAFQLAPAMGLAPELPGSVAADLGARQVWWWLTVGCTATALGLLAYGRGLAMAGLALVLLALPHVIGAPQPDGFAGSAPPELSAQFAARVLGVGLAVWACLGWAAGWFWSRSQD